MDGWPLTQKGGGIPEGSSTRQALRVLTQSPNSKAFGKLRSPRGRKTGFLIRNLNPQLLQRGLVYGCYVRVSNDHVIT